MLVLAFDVESVVLEMYGLFVSEDCDILEISKVERESASCSSCNGVFIISLSLLLLLLLLLSFVNILVRECGVEFKKLLLFLVPMLWLLLMEDGMVLFPDTDEKLFWLLPEKCDLISKKFEELIGKVMAATP